MQRPDSVYLNRTARSIVKNINDELKYAQRYDDSYFQVKIINNHKFINNTIGGLEHTYISSCVYQEDGRPYSNPPKYNDEAIVALFRIYRDPNRLTRCVSSVTISRAKGKHEGKLEISSWTVKNEPLGREILAVGDHNNPNQYSLHMGRLNRGKKNQGMSFNSLLRPLALRMIAFTGKPMVSIAINVISIYLLKDYTWNHLLVSFNDVSTEGISQMIAKLAAEGINFKELMMLKNTYPRAFANKLRKMCTTVPHIKKFMNILSIHSMVITLNPAEPENLQMMKKKITEAMKKIVKKEKAQ
jgi:hypothetical protein